MSIGLGDKVTSKFDLTDYDGEEFNVGEVGEVVKSTSSTIHVLDPRGHIHIRYRYFFEVTK